MYNICKEKKYVFVDMRKSTNHKKDWVRKSQIRKSNKKRSIHLSCSYYESAQLSSCNPMTSELFRNDIAIRRDPGFLHLMTRAYFLLVVFFLFSLPMQADRRGRGVGAIQNNKKPLPLYSLLQIQHL